MEEIERFCRRRQKEVAKLVHCGLPRYNEGRWVVPMASLFCEAVFVIASTLKPQQEENPSALSEDMKADFIRNRKRQRAVVQVAASAMNE